MPQLSLRTFAIGARQFVVQDALETTFMSGVYLSRLTPQTNIGASLDGAEMTTFFAPALMCASAFAVSVKTPVDSTTYSAPTSPHGISSGFIFAKNLTSLPSTMIELSVNLMSPLYWPCIVS